MGALKNYIAESILTEKGSGEGNADLIYQKILDVLDHAHLDFGEDRIQFHIGRIIKNSNIDVEMVIRLASTNSVKLGRSKSGTYTIVVDTRDQMPVRSEIDSFLAKNRHRAVQIKNALVKYLSDHYMNQEDPKTRTKYEEEVYNNDDDNFEKHYENIIKELQNRMEECTGTIEELRAEMDTEDIGTRETAKMAISQISKEAFGKDLNEFKKIVKGILGKHGDGLTKENKEKMVNRLDSFYDQKIKPIYEQ